MREILRPKLLLFFAISIMSFYITSETTYATNASDSYSLNSYVEMGKKSLMLIGLYCQQIYNSGYKYVHSFFASKNDVKIQIMGKKVIVQDADNGSLCTDADLSDEQGDHCQPGDLVCQNNMDYFNTAYFTGDLIQDGEGSEKIDQFDDKYCGYTAAERELLYEHTDAINDGVDVSNEDGNAFDNIKHHYEAIDYKELSGH